MPILTGRAKQGYFLPPTGRRYRWLRRAALSLACIVPIFVAGHAALGMQPTWSPVYETKLGEPRNLECVPISDFSRYVDSSCSSLNGGPFVGSHWRLAPTANMELRSGADMALGLSAETRRSLRLVFQRICRDSNGCPERGIIRGSLTGIFENYLNERVGIEVNQFCVPGKNVGPQLPFGGVLKVSQLTFASRPQSIGGPFQSESESGDGDGSKRSPELSVKDSIPSIQDRDVQRIVQFALLLCAILCGLAYIKIDWMKHKNTNGEQQQSSRKSQGQ
jgi:hypothetical protein